MHSYLIQFDTGRERYCVKSDGEEDLLEAIQSSGVPVRRACRNGVCGVCRCRLLAGDISYRDRLPHGLQKEDIDRGYILPCIAFASSNLLLQVLRSEPDE